MRVTYITEDPYEGKTIFKYNSVKEFVKKYPMYKEFLSGDRAKMPHTIEITIPFYSLVLKVILEEGEQI